MGFLNNDLMRRKNNNEKHTNLYKQIHNMISNIKLSKIMETKPGQRK